jgi:large subunit ribosomal protein L23
MKTLASIIIEPVITEKSVNEAKAGKYSFKVQKAANKYEIAKAVEALFQVKVVGVSTNIIKETKIRNTKFGRSKSDLTYKKARVKLAPDQKIDLFEVGEK